MAAQTMLNGLLLFERKSETDHSQLSEEQSPDWENKLAWTPAFNYFNGNYYFDVEEGEPIHLFGSNIKYWNDPQLIAACGLDSYGAQTSAEAKILWLEQYLGCRYQNSDTFKVTYNLIMPQVDRAITDFYATCGANYDPLNPLLCDPTDGAFALLVPTRSSTEAYSVVKYVDLMQPQAEADSMQAYSEHRGLLRSGPPPYFDRSASPTILHNILWTQLDFDYEPGGNPYSGFQWTSWAFQRQYSDGQDNGKPPGDGYYYAGLVIPRMCTVSRPCEPNPRQ
jgi:hypothetical protein